MSCSIAPSCFCPRPADPPSPPLSFLQTLTHALFPARPSNSTHFVFPSLLPLLLPSLSLSSLSILFYFLRISTSSSSSSSPLPSHHIPDYIQFHNSIISSFLVVLLDHLSLIFILSACGWTLLPRFPSPIPPHPINPVSQFCTITAHPAQGMNRQQRDSSTSLNLIHTRCAPSVRLIPQSYSLSSSTY